MTQFTFIEKYAKKFNNLTLNKIIASYDTFLGERYIFDFINVLNDHYYVYVRMTNGNEFNIMRQKRFIRTFISYLNSNEYSSKLIWNKDYPRYFEFVNDNNIKMIDSFSKALLKTFDL